MSLGPLIYVVVADLFPDSVRGSAMSVCIFFNFLSNLVFGVAFPYIADALDNLSFLPFIAMLVIFYLIMRQMLPETLGKTGDEIQNEFRELREKKQQAKAKHLTHSTHLVHDSS
ncbi:Solute carrier family 2 [Globisporangium polare]